MRVAFGVELALLTVMMVLSVLINLFDTVACGVAAAIRKK